MEELPEILQDLESKHNIEIIFSSIGGSKANGLDNKDSDFDINFIFKPALRDLILTQESNSIDIKKGKYDLS